MCRVLNMSVFRIFVNFRKYDMVLNMCWDAIMEKFRILSMAGLWIPAYVSVLNMSEYDRIMPYGRVLDMPNQCL